MPERRKTCTNRAYQLSDVVHSPMPGSGVRRGSGIQHWSHGCPGMAKTAVLSAGITTEAL